LRNPETEIGFVPTMGALHDGHLALLRRARACNEVTVCSIFVNPIQFNNPDDLKNYPRTLESDSEKLESVNCDILFYPNEKEMYPVPETKVYDFGQLDKVMEGEHRPGHFNGVAIIVRKLLEIVEPNRVYFGEKDFQQLQIVKALVRIENIKVKIIPCPTVREPDGLAMSSRNVRLSPEQRTLAPVIHKLLSEIPLLKNNMSVSDVKHYVFQKINMNNLMQLEYLEIAEPDTLTTITDWPVPGSKLVACIAVQVGNVRLIDNHQFNS
jgi:pantoate--beta-alanine ligase